jgi:hypothetical protein
MFRAFVAVAVGLLLVTQLNAEDRRKESAGEKKPDAKEQAEAKTSAETTKTATETQSGPSARQRGRAGGKRFGEGHHGRVGKAALENGVLKVTVDGKDYELRIGDRTHAVIRTADKDGKEEVIGVMLMNGEHRRGADGKPPTRPATK